MNYNLVITLTNGTEQEFTINIPDGVDGASIRAKGSVATKGDLPDVATAEIGDSYIVEGGPEGEAGHLYILGTEKDSEEASPSLVWVDMGRIVGRDGEGGQGGDNPFVIVNGSSSNSEPAKGDGTNNVIIGADASAINDDYTPNSVVAIGYGSFVSNNRTIAIGPGAKALVADSVSIGSKSITNWELSVAIGSEATTLDHTSIAIGASSNANHFGAIALGSSSQTYRNNTLSVGNEDWLRGITCVDEAQERTDVPNWGQVQDLVKSIEIPDNKMVRKVTSGNISWNNSDKPSAEYATGKLGPGCYAKFTINFYSINTGVVDFVPVVTLSRAPCDKDGVIIPHQLYVSAVTASNNTTPKAQAVVLMDRVPTHTINTKTLEIVPVGRLDNGVSAGIPDIPIVSAGEQKVGNELGYSVSILVSSKDLK